MRGLQERLAVVMLGAALTSIQPNSQLASAYTITDRIVRVVDGDTIVAEQAGKVRLTGVDTPETVAPAQRRGEPPQCYGPEASAETKRLLPEGARVRFETDASEKDSFGRVLAYVYRCVILSHPVPSRPIPSLLIPTISCHACEAYIPAWG